MMKANVTRILFFRKKILKILGKTRRAASGEQRPSSDEGHSGPAARGYVPASGLIGGGLSSSLGKPQDRSDEDGRQTVSRPPDPRGLGGGVS
jgi:hypothetical protein